MTDVPPAVGLPAAAPARDRLIASVPFHYGWLILVGGAIGSFMTLPGQTNGVSLFFDAIAAELALSRGQVAVAYTIGTLAGALPTPLVGRWIDRRGPRRAVAIIAVAMGLACVVMALTWSALTLAVGFAALRGATIGGLSLVSQHVINLWFVFRRGMAATAASIGVAAGGVVFPPLIDALIQSGGWRHAYATLGVIVAGTMLPLGLLVFRDRPERFGLAPDLGLLNQRSRVKPEPAFTRAEALGTPVFWAISLANVLTNALGTGLLLNHFDLLLRGGLGRDTAVLAFAPLAITQVVAAVAIGPLVDRFTPHRLLMLPMVSMAFTCLFVATVASGGEAFIYAMTLGFAYGSFQAINAAVYAHYFGRRHAGEIRGVTFVITIVGAALGPLPFGWLSASESYFPVLASGAALCLIAATLNVVIRRPRGDDPYP